MLQVHIPPEEAHFVDVELFSGVAFFIALCLWLSLHAM